MNKLCYCISFVTDQDQVNIFLVLSFFQIDGDFVMYGEFTEGTVIKRRSPYIDGGVACLSHTWVGCSIYKQIFQYRSFYLSMIREVT